MKITEGFHTSTQNINKKINVYPCKTQYYCIKVGFKGIKTI